MEEVTSRREVNSNERYVMGLSRMIAGGRMASVFSLVSAIMLVVLFLGLISPAQVSAQTVFAVTSDNDLLRFEVSNPTIVVQEPIIGLRRNENINSIDFRPATGQLFALSSRSRLYTINPDTGQATQVGSDGAFRLRGAFFGFDFNPVPDRIRVVSDNEQNLRLNPDDGTLTARDGALAFADGDVNEGINPNVVGSAYSNSVAGATTTTLYGIDSNLDMLVIQDPPNDGVLSTVGSLGVNVGGPVGFDILTTGGGDTAFTALRTSSGVSSLFTIDLGTGRATRVGTINSGDLIRGLTVVLGPAVSPTPILSPTPDGSPSPTPDGSPSPTPDGSPSPTPDGSPSPTPDGSPTPPASPSPTSPNVPGSNGGCSIGGGTVQLGTAMANLLIPLVPAFAIGFRAIRRRKK